jgi:hypothetical protein
MGKLLNSIFILFMILLLFSSMLGCTGSRGSSSATFSGTAARLAFIQGGIITENSLDIFLGIYDGDGHLLNAKGEVEVVLWENRESTVDSQCVPIQHWKDLPVNADSFEEATGNWLSMKYIDFIPQPEQTGYMIITFIPAAGAEITCAGEILLLRGSCCA